MDAAQVCRSLGGVASRAELTAAGARRRDIDKALAERTLHLIARGIYATPQASPLRCAERVWRGSATCVSVLRELKLPARARDSAAHLAIDAHRSLAGVRRHHPRIRLHWVADPTHAATVLGALDVASLCLRDIDQLAAVDAALGRGLVTLKELERLTVTPPSRAAWLRLHCDPGAQSPPETYARVAMREAGLPVSSQVQLAGAGRVDFVVDGTVVVEIDGKSYHMNERAFWEDRRRDRVAQVAGLDALRFTREDVENDLGGLVDTVAAVVQLNRARAGKAPLSLVREPPAVPWTRTWAWQRTDARKKWRMN